MKNEYKTNVHHQEMLRQWRVRQAKRASNGLWFALVVVMALSGLVGIVAVVLLG